MTDLSDTIRHLRDTIVDHRKQFQIHLTQPIKKKGNTATITVYSDWSFRFLSDLYRWLSTEEHFKDKVSYRGSGEERTTITELKKEYQEERRRALIQVSIAKGNTAEDSDNDELLDCILACLNEEKRMAVSLDPANANLDEIDKSINEKYAANGRIFFPAECYNTFYLISMIYYPTITLQYDLGDNVHTLLWSVINTC